MALTKVCPGCGKRFRREVGMRHWARRVYCSRDCYATRPALPQCRHCHARPAGQPRGLCWTCYMTPGVRDLYPPTSKYAPRGRADFCGTPPLPAEPTAAAPGSAEKLAVLEARAAAGLALSHPHDADMGYGKVWDWQQVQAEEARERAEAEELRAARLWAVWGGRRAVASHPWDAPARAQ